MSYKPVPFFYDVGEGVDLEWKIFVCKVQVFSVIVCHFLVKVESDR